MINNGGKIMITYPNQKVITVFKEKCSKDFLQINNGSWKAASNLLTYSAFKIYLYIASNRDTYTFALSYAAINEDIPMNRKTYDKAIKELIDCGYLYQSDAESNNWIFSEV